MSTRPAQALRGGLVDECHLHIWPMVVGGGKPAMPTDTRADLELLDERRFGNGVVLLRYRPLSSDRTPCLPLAAISLHALERIFGPLWSRRGNRLTGRQPCRSLPPAVSVSIAGSTRPGAH